MKFGGEVNICVLYVPEFFQIFWSGGPWPKNLGMPKNADKSFFSYFQLFLASVALPKAVTIKRIAPSYSTRKNTTTLAANIFRLFKEK